MTMEAKLSMGDIIAKARKAKSLMHREELEWLLTLAQRAPEGLAVELGVYCGASLIGIALARQGRGDVAGVDDWSYKDIDGLRDKAIANFTEAGVEDVGVITATSSQAASIITAPLAFLHIDGDHTRKGIEGDMMMWLPKLMLNGIVVFHDYGRRKNDCYVTEAVDKWYSLNNRHWFPLGSRGTTAGFLRKDS